MKRIRAEQYRGYDAVMCELEHRLFLLECRRDEMSQEDYLRERSLINYKKECHMARFQGKWENVKTTYKYEDYEKRK